MVWGEWKPYGNPMGTLWKPYDPMETLWQYKLTRPL